MNWLGLGYRGALAAFIDGHRTQLDFLEITAEHFFDAPEQAEHLRRRYPLAVHGLGLSLGTPGPLDGAYLERFMNVCKHAKPVWISDHLAFTRSEDIDLGHLNPIALTHDALDLVSDHVAEVMAVAKARLLLENITSHLTLPGDYSEPAFLNRLCERTGAGVLLDVTNLYVNTCNCGIAPAAWLDELNPEFVVQMHIIGYSIIDGRFEDQHREAVQDDLLVLLDRVLQHTGPRPLLLEWDRAWPGDAALMTDLDRLRRCLDSHGIDPRYRQIAV